MKLSTKIIIATLAAMGLTSLVGPMVLPVKDMGKDLALAGEETEVECAPFSEIEVCDSIGFGVWLQIVESDSARSKATITADRLIMNNITISQTDGRLRVEFDCHTDTILRRRINFNLREQLEGQYVTVAVPKGTLRKISSDCYKNRVEGLRADSITVDFRGRIIFSKSEVGVVNDVSVRQNNADYEVILTDSTTFSRLNTGEPGLDLFSHGGSRFGEVYWTVDEAGKPNLNASAANVDVIYVQAPSDTIRSTITLGTPYRTRIIER